MSEDLTAGEYDQLWQLLRRFAERHLDQSEHLRFETKYGPVFIVMTRALPPQWPAKAFTLMPPSSPSDS